MRLQALFVLGLCLAALPAPASEAEALSPSAQTAPAAAAGVSPEAQALDASASAPPSLPVDASGQPLPVEEPADPAKAAQVDVPKEDPASIAPGKPVAEAKPGRFRFGNFALAFAGGALLGGAYGVLASGGKDSAAMAQNAGIYAGAAGLVLGTAGLFLGATSPEEAKPPQVEAWLLPRPAGAELALRF